MNEFPGWKDKILFTPGPLTTSRTVKQAMLRDLGSRDFSFIETVKDIRRRLLSAGEVEDMDYEAIPMQGSGTFSVETVISACVKPGGKVLVVINGAYGQRIKKICEVLQIDTAVLEYPENVPVEPEEVAAAIEREGDVSMVAIVHCETTTGIMNPVEEIGQIVRKSGARYFVDAMSSFGAVPLNLAAARIDYLVSSANKCIEGVPGFGFVIARRKALEETEGWARSLSFDLHAQWKSLEANGQFRFTPPTHVLLAFHQALLELEQEGGVAARGKRYQQNYETLVAGMRALGFSAYLPEELQGYIITSFFYPDDPKWDFETFYRLLNERNYVIYPGKVSNANCFRIGNIGRTNVADICDLLAAIRDTVEEMEMALR